MLTDTILSLGIMICFYYGLTAIGCVWYFRQELFTSFYNVVFKFLLPLIGGIGLWAVFFITLRDSASPEYDGTGVEHLRGRRGAGARTRADLARGRADVDHPDPAAGLLPRRDAAPGHPLADHPGMIGGAGRSDRRRGAGRGWAGE